MKHYQMIMESSGGSLDGLLSKLKNLSSNHFSQQAVEPIQLKVLTDYINLLGKRILIKLYVRVYFTNIHFQIGKSLWAFQKLKINL